MDEKHPADTPSQCMLDRLNRQRTSLVAAGEVSIETRRDRLRCALDLLESGKDGLAAAMSEDFGSRSRFESLMFDIAASVVPLHHALKNVGRWMQPEKRRVGPFPLRLLGAKARVIFQPLGVVGIISPWNFPVYLIFAPLAGILAAGNRCLIKPSEYTPATSALLAELVAKHFDPLEVSVCPGGSRTGEEFAALPFDHLVFTGSAAVARHILRAAAENLVPVTLELGGKCPVVVGRTANLARAAESVMATKLLNAGQMCVAPDYIFVPRDLVGEFTTLAKAAVQRLYPTLVANADYTSVINEHHFDRLQGCLDDARSHRVQVVEINPGGEDFGDRRSRKIMPTLVIDPPDRLALMQEEIFGPILPVIPYDTIRDVLARIRSQASPLAIYYFGHDAAEKDEIIAQTASGSITINDVMMQIAQEDLPFGGVGGSGTGAYHGRDGFRRFSHARAVYTQSPFNVARMAGLRPPYP